jgi:hypothetical protein
LLVMSVRPFAKTFSPHLNRLRVAHRCASTQSRDATATSNFALKTRIIQTSVIFSLVMQCDSKSKRLRE